MSGRQPQPDAPLAGIALSTMWAQRFDDDSSLEPFFADGRRLGFDRFEVGHVVSRPAALELVPGRYKIASVHSPCPGDLMAAGASLAHPESDRRREAATALVRSIELAERLGAGAVMFHLGKVEWDTDLKRAAFELASRTLGGQAHTERWCAARDRLVQAIGRVERDALARASDALGPACEAARGAGIALAFETGHSPLELPTPRGGEWLLDQLGAHGLTAWLDTGHVAAQAAVGVSDFADWFVSVSGRWSGVHVHDCVGLRDHLAPGTGGIDLGAVIARLPADALITLEVDWYLDDVELVAGARTVLELLGAVGPGGG